MFATIVQKWNMFKADLKEYCKLHRLVSGAWHEFYSARENITVYSDADENKKSCITVEWKMSISDYKLDAYGSQQNVLVPYNNYCPHFRGGRFDEKEVCSCGQTNCPCYAGNCEYVAAAHELANARRNRRNFWDNKSKAK